MNSKTRFFNLEEKYLQQIAPSLPFFTRQSNSSRLQCPYCQHGSKDHKGRRMSPSYCKGFFYSKGNALNYKCYLCGVGKQFHNFLEDFYPTVFLDYVAERERFGLTGKGTNAPTLTNALSRSPATVQVSDQNISTVGRTDPLGVTGDPKRVVPLRTEYTTIKLKRPTREQQAGLSSGIDHKVKQYRKRRSIDAADAYLSKFGL